MELVWDCVQWWEMLRIVMMMMVIIIIIIIIIIISCTGYTRSSFCRGCSMFCRGCSSFCTGRSALCWSESERLAWFKHFVTGLSYLFHHLTSLFRKFSIIIWATFYAPYVGDWMLLQKLSSSVIKVTPQIFLRSKSRPKYVAPPKFFSIFIN